MRRFLGRQIVLQCGLREIAYPAKQVKLERRHPQPHLIMALHLDASAPAQVSRQTLTGRAPLKAHSWQLIGTLDAIQRPGSLDVEQALAQVTIVAQRQLHQRPQAGIRDKTRPV